MALLSMSAVVHRKTIAAFTTPFACLLFVIGYMMYVGLPGYYHRVAGGIPSVYHLIFRRRIVLV